MIASATTNTAVARPSQPATIAVWPACFGGLSCGIEFGGEMHGPVGEQRGPPGGDGVPVDDALNTETLVIREPFHARERRVGLGGGGDGAGDRVLGGVLEPTDQPQARARPTPSAVTRR